MQHVAPNALRPVSTTTAKASAINAYDAACADPATADWRAVADLLRAALPASRAKAAPASVTGSAPRWWADWKLGKVYSLDSLEVLFSDGVRVRCNIAQAPGKLPRIAAACRVAIAFYRAKTRRSGVPSFAHIENVSDGEIFDAAACSRLTADLRAASYGDPAPRKPVTVEAVERMERELDRRRAGLARVARGDTAFTTADGKAWLAAVQAGEEELAQMRAECEPSEPVALIPAATIVSPEINVVPEKAPSPAEGGGHFEPMAICPAVGMPCKVDCPHRAGCGPVRPVAPRPRPIPAAIAARALAASLRGSAAYHVGALR